MTASLRRADLHYGNGVQLHTAASGSVGELQALYLCLDDGEHQAVGEVRINIAYLNGYTPGEVIAQALKAVSAVSWQQDPAQLLAQMPHWAAALSMPVRTLIDCALHDLLARRAGLPLAQWLGAPDAKVRYASNQTLFWSPFEVFLAQADAYVNRGFRDLKVRIAVSSFDEDLIRLQALRERFGSEIKIAVDVNGQWPQHDALSHLEALARFDLAYAEQPIAAGGWEAMERLAEQSPLPLMIDEGLAGSEDVDRLCALGGKVWAHLKLVKIGGIAPCVSAARRLTQAGVTCMIGQMNEGAAATAAALHVACTTQPRFAELYGADGLSDDPASPLLYRDGQAWMPTAPGLGITLDLEKTQLIRSF
ncbi:mandelate racemase [Pseudomonas syringae]|uniref:Mandelate racemase n=1 Tax=Pseudomonas syringae TaxID=317 RepID=A0A1C7ZAJ1_PSESX|nr:mandelate racemase [Pseudomonas syringae]